MSTMRAYLLGLVGVLILSGAARGEECTFDEPELTAECAAINHQIAQWNANPAAQDRLKREAESGFAHIGDRPRSVGVVLRRTALLADICGMTAHRSGRRNAAAPPACVKSRRIAPDSPKRKDLLSSTVCALRRGIAVQNPLLDFDRIVFLEHGRARYEHMVDQYYGFHAARGGGVFVLEDAFGERPSARDLLEDARVENGRLRGKPLDGGSFISLDLSFDAQRILFAWTEAQTPVEPTDRTPMANLWNPQSTYHPFSSTLAGSELKQLTDGPLNDFDPCYLPNGRIVSSPNGAAVFSANSAQSDVRCTACGPWVRRYSLELPRRTSGTQASATKRDRPHALGLRRPRQ